MVIKIKRRGLMFVISSPSGAGKTTLAKLLLEADQHLHVSVSYTTRPKRKGEQHGIDYFFVDNDVFDEMSAAGEFLETATVFGNKYGTPYKFVEEKLRLGEDVLFDIEWQGNRQLIHNARADVASIFIFPPSKQELLNRLRARNQDSEENVIHRMLCANEEISHWSEYDYAIINRQIDVSLNKLLAILHAERLKKVRRLGVASFAQSLIQEKVIF